MILGLRLNLLRVLLKSSKHRECFNSTVVTNVGVKLSSATVHDDKSLKSDNPHGTSTNVASLDKGLAPAHPVDKTSPIVTAAFASLKEIDLGKSELNLGSLDERIDQAKTAEELLALIDKRIISKTHAYKVFSILSTWTVKKKVEVSTLEKDPRFLKLCELLNKTVKKHIMAARNETMADDLHIVTDVSNEDEAAKLSSTLNLQQLVKVLHSLAMKQKRSMTLLRSLAFNITENAEELNIKLCSDVLYSLAYLSYPEEVLLSRVASDLYKCIPPCDRPAVIKSIITSVGMLRYRDTELLEILSDWILKNMSICGPQELVSLVQTLANVNFKPTNEKTLQTILSSLNLEGGLNVTTWVDIIWSLAVLGEATSEHVSSVLHPEFIEKLNMAFDSLPIVFKLKLAQINGFAKLCISDYSGPLLDSSKDIFDVKLQRTKEKQFFVSGVFDTLANLLPSSTYLLKDVDLGFGILIDGVCQIDEKMTPVALTDKKTGERINDTKGAKIAIMVYNFHDFCRGSHNQLNGLNSLGLKLIEQSGYKIVSVPYYEFLLSDKLPSRVQYLENKLKTAVKNK